MAEREGRLPQGSTDTHMHIYEPGHPANPLAAPPEPEATLAHYRREMARIGIDRAVIVQPSAFGTDNQCTLAAIAALGPEARGVAILDEAVTERELDLLAAQGIVGLRGLLTSPAGMMTWERVRVMAPRVVARGWNLNLQFDGREFAERADFLDALPGQLVFDHIGLFPAPLDPDGPELAPLLRLLDSGRAWIKLSAPYYVEGSARPIRKPPPWCGVSSPTRPNAASGPATGRIRSASRAPIRSPSPSCWRTGRPTRMCATASWSRTRPASTASASRPQPTRSMRPE